MVNTQFVWDVATDSYLMEKDVAGATNAVYTNEPVLFGKSLSQHRGGITSYYHFDVQQSTSRLSDQQQNVTDAYSYLGFGESGVTTGATTNPLRFGGRLGYYLDHGTYYVRRRIYQGGQGRWLSVDVNDSDDPSYNLYRAVRNSPLAVMDPSGEIVWIPVILVGGGIACCCIVLETLVEASKFCAHLPKKEPVWIDCLVKQVAQDMKNSKILATAIGTCALGCIAVSFYLADLYGPVVIKILKIPTVK